MQLTDNHEALSWFTAEQKQLTSYRLQNGRNVNVWGTFASFLPFSWSRTGCEFFKGTKVISSRQNLQSVTPKVDTKRNKIVYQNAFKYRVSVSHMLHKAQAFYFFTSVNKLRVSVKWPFTVAKHAVQTSPSKFKDVKSSWKDSDFKYCLL